MRITLDKQRSMHRSRILKNDLKVSHRCKEGGAGEHKVTPGGLQAGGGDACWLVGLLAKCVCNCAKIRKAEFPKQLRHGGDVRWLNIEIPSNENGALRVRPHLINDSTDDSIGFGCLGGQLGSISEPINDIAGEAARRGGGGNMQMDNAPSFMLHAEGRCEWGNLKDTAPIVPNGPDTTSGGVVVGIHFGASKPSVAFSQLSFDALKLSRVAAEFLQQGNLGFPASKNLQI